MTRVKPPLVYIQGERCPGLAAARAAGAVLGEGTGGRHVGPAHGLKVPSPREIEADRARGGLIPARGSGASFRVYL